MGDTNRVLRHLQNKKEVEAIVLLARYLQDLGKSYRIITPYDAQRSELERALQDEDLNWHDKCFNVDSFQGHFLVLTHPEVFITDTEFQATKTTSLSSPWSAPKSPDS